MHTASRQPELEPFLLLLASFTSLLLQIISCVTLSVTYESVKWHCQEVYVCSNRPIIPTPEKICVEVGFEMSSLFFLATLILLYLAFMIYDMVKNEFLSLSSLSLFKIRFPVVIYGVVKSKFRRVFSNFNREPGHIYFVTANLLQLLSSLLTRIVRRQYRPKALRENVNFY